MGDNPLDVYREMFDRAFGSSRALRETLRSTTPLILTGLAVTVCFRMGLWSIGAEGCRQGFTGEIGYEFFVPTGDGADVWDGLFDVGESLGLGAGGLHAADVARIEAGMVIVGADYTPATMDRLGDPLPVSPENMTTPLELNLHRNLSTGDDRLGVPGSPRSSPGRDHDRARSPLRP